MSSFLSQFAQFISHTPRDASVARTWAKLLPLVCENAGPAWRRGGLWLLDRHDDHEHLTLWNWWSKDGLETGSPHNVAATLHAKAAVNAPFESQFAEVRERLEAIGALIPGMSLRAEPIVVPQDGTIAPETVGFLTLFAEGDVELEPAFADDLKIACGLVGAWMKLGREWRKSTAVAQFQKAQNEDHDEATLADCAAEQLQRYASAQLAVCIYAPHRGRLGRLGTRATSRVPSEVPAEAFVHAYHFGAVRGFRKPTNIDEVQLEFDESGALVAPAEGPVGVSVEDFPEILERGKPISVLLARIKDTNGRGDGHGIDEAPPIATLMMATAAAEGFIGGRFSDTNRAVMRLIMDAFRNAYCLAVQRDRMDAIAQAVAAIAKTRTSIDIINDEGDELDFAPFAELARDCLPNVLDAVVCQIGAGDRVEAVWPAHARDADWIPRHRGGTGARAVRWTRGRWTSSRDVERGSGGAMITLGLLTAVPRLPHIEQSLLERIIVEARIQQHLHVNKDGWAQQLAEVRHNMRAVLSSVLGKVELLSNRYEAVVRTGDRNEVYRRLVSEGHFRKNIRALNLAGKELEAIFENIRALVGKLDESALQISEFELPQLILSTIAILDLEAERRGITFNFVDMSPPDLRRVVGDPVWTRIALFNLFENAIKYSDKNGRIEVLLRVRGSHWQLTVTDIGRYIPPDMVDVIFLPYQRVRQKPGLQTMPGTGLGLMTVKRYVQLHQNREAPAPGGRAIVVESAPLERHGSAVIRARTSFTISLPRRGPDRNA